MSYITTYQHKSFDPLNATADEIDIRDIAHALSLLCRANGHFPQFYSVAQHSLNCMKEAKARGYSKRVQLGCLLHDASEAYLSDVTRPIKSLLPQYLEIEEHLQNIIFDKWLTPTLTDEERRQIFAVDDALLYFEFIYMMQERIFLEEPSLVSIPDFSVTDFKNIEMMFVSALFDLMGESVSVGVDWMCGRWIAVELCHGIAKSNIFHNISDLCIAYKNIGSVLIDVPIGLPMSLEEAAMRPDAAARAFLKNPKRKSSVFNVPFRQMAYAENFEQAWELRLQLGAKTSKQGLGILPCIRQVDEFLEAHPDWRLRLVESHPECAFQALNANEGLAFSKHTEDGITERITILSKSVWNIDELLQSVTKRQREDVLDALCLAVTAETGFKNINKKVAYDSKGLPMRIVVADI